MLREERLRYWLGVGAQPSDRVARFLDSAGITQNATRWRGTGKRAEEIAAQKAEAEAAGRSRGSGSWRCAGGRAQPPQRRRRPAAAEAEATAAVEAPAAVEAAAAGTDAADVEQARGRRTCTRANQRSPPATRTELCRASGHGAASARSRWVCVAVVAGAHGLRGALKLRCFTERRRTSPPTARCSTDTAGGCSSCEVIGPAPGGVLARADGIEDRNAAEALRGTELFVPRSALPELRADEFYYSDLEGMEALRRRRLALRRGAGVDNFGAGDVIEVLADDGRRISLPFTRRTVPSDRSGAPPARGRAARGALPEAAP